jgi:hypothetical protein
VRILHFNVKIGLLEPDFFEMSVDLAHSDFSKVDFWWAKVKPDFFSDFFSDFFPVREPCEVGFPQVQSGPFLRGTFPRGGVAPSHFSALLPSGAAALLL